jgi:osmotically-inducible protein OsmY
MTDRAAGTPIRQDAEIFGEARRALDARLNVPAIVRVHVEHGTATLTGSVRLPAERMEAEETVRAVPGVQRVINEILVARPPSPAGLEPPDENA